MDAIITEAHFDAYVVALVKSLVASARKGRLAMLPVRDAWIMWRAASALHGSVSGAAAAASGGGARAPHSLEAVAGALRAAAGAIGDASAPPSALAALGLPLRYGELFEGLLRGWRLLPIGLYRRVHPAFGLKTAAGTVNALIAAAGAPSCGSGSGEGGGFGHNRALVSFVYTNPTPETKLSPHDVLYVMHSSDGEEEVRDAVEAAAGAAAAAAGAAGV